MSGRGAVESARPAERLGRRLAELPADRRALLERWMAERGIPLERLPIVRVPPRPDYPASFAQRRLWFLDRLRPGDPAFNVPTAARLRGPFDGRAFDRAVAAVIDRHDALRTAFRAPEGEPVQVVRPAAAVRSSWLDLGALPATRRVAEAGRALRLAVRRPFDLGAGPMLRSTVVRLGADDHVVALTVHHVATDDWSMSLIVRDVAALYRAGRLGREPELPPAPPVRYVDYSVWQRRHLDRLRLRGLLDYWTAALAGVPAELPLRTDKPRVPAAASDGDSVAFALDAETAAGLRRLGREHGRTLFAPLLAGYQLVLSWLAGIRDVAVGSPVANRNRAELEEVVGLFFNTLVLRTRFERARTFRELVAAAAAAVAGAFAHQELPFELLVEALRPGRARDESPLFRVTFTLHNAPVENPRLERLETEPFGADGGTARADLMFDVVEGPSRLHARLSYRRALFLPATAERLAGQVAGVLRRAAAEPEVELEELHGAWLRAEAEQRADAARRLRHSRSESLRGLRRTPAGRAGGGA